MSKVKVQAKNNTSLLHHLDLHILKSGKPNNLFHNDVRTDYFIRFNKKAIHQETQNLVCS
jgi:hypothetical protein